MGNENKKLDRAFNPRSVAVVGDKQQTGFMWLRSLSTFTGKVYSVQIDPKEIPGIEALGVKNYLTLLDIPEAVDYVIVAVPRAVTPKIVADCIQKKVGAVSLFTSGFAETNTEEGIRLQNIITQMAKENGLNLIGPNCMGIFNPEIGLRHGAGQYAGESGPVGFISQSGALAGSFSMAGAANGFKISKSVSYGNAVVLDSTDYLEYLAEDEDTKIIAMYIEGVKDGRRFFQCLRETAKKKPVLIWKGGQTEEGTRAAASHTGAMAVSIAIWEAVIKQCGAIKVNSMEEMIDTIKAFLYMKAVTGIRIGLVAMTGGYSVAITDSFARAGLEVPLLTEESYREFASFFNIIGSSYRNPLDISSNFFGAGDPTKNLVRMLDILDGDPNIDFVGLQLAAGFVTGGRRRQRDPRFFDKLLDALSDFKSRSDKPFLTIISAEYHEVEAAEIKARLLEKGIPSFPSHERGAKALKKLVDYYRTHLEVAS